MVNYNGLDCLAATLDGLVACSRPFAEIIVVDDGSTDGSVQMVRTDYPQVHLIALERNTANLALVRNTGLRAAKSRHVFLTDNDVVLRSGCVEQLLQTMQACPGTFSVVPRLLDQDDPSLVYQSGNDLHFLAVSTGSRRGEPQQEHADRAPRCSIGGGIMLLDLELVEKLGYFDTGYVHGWLDDGELHYRGRLAGYTSLHDPAALALVKVRQHGRKRAYGQYCNRLRLMATGYQLRTLLSLSPVLLAFELGLLLFTLANGTFAGYLGAWLRLIRNRDEIRAARQRLQGLRRLGDAQLLRHGAFEIPGLWKLSAPARGVILASQRSCDVFWWLAYPVLRSH